MERCQCCEREFKKFYDYPHVFIKDVSLIKPEQVHIIEIYINNELFFLFK